MSLTTLLHSARNLGWLPLLPANYTLLLRLWRYFPLVLPIQLSTTFYPMGKTSFSSIFNLPGKPAWMIQELLSPLFLLLNLYPSSSARPSKENAFLAALFCIHYFHRAIVSPLLNPSMAPMHAIMFCSAVGFNYVNGSLIGAWLGGRGEAAGVPVWQGVIGGLVFAAGFAGNIYHEELLRDIRRPGKHAQEAKEKGQEVVEGDGRVYRVPQGGLFRWCWFPHYFCEWIEWTGFMIAAGGPWKCVPAAMFLINELATMGPRAIQGKRWYKEKFGAKTPERYAVVPGIL